MALTVTSRGTGTHNTGATTLVPDGRTATLAAGSLGVLCIAVDNEGTGGSTLIAPASWTDAKGNTWANRINALYDNGAASAGIEMVFYTAPITVALLTTDAGTITWGGSKSPVAKAWTWYEVIPSAGTAVYSTGGSIAGATAANAQVVTSTVPVGDAVIAGYFSENVAAVTGDSDSTNGSWTAQQTTTVGTTTSGVRIATQQKVQTTTASTQSYDVTVNSQDRIAGYILLHELNNITVTPTTLALTTGPLAPTVTKTNHQLVTAGLLAAALAVFAPTVTTPRLVTPSVTATSLSSFAPTVTTPRLVTPPPGTLTVEGFAPTVTTTANLTVTPDTTGLTLTPQTATVLTPQLATPTTATLDLVTFSPTVTASAHVTVTPDAVALIVSGLAPTVTVGDGQTPTPPNAALVLTPFAPTVTATANMVATPTLATLTTTGYEPDVDSAANVTVTPATVALTITIYAPTATTAELSSEWHVVVGEVAPVTVLTTVAAVDVESDPASIWRVVAVEEEPITVLIGT